MMQKLIITLLFLTAVLYGSAQSNGYVASPEILKARSTFQDMKYGMFIHWGASSVLGDGEWVMHNRNIRVKEYSRLMSIFNPIHFDAEKWVGLAKAAGMKYIIFVTRHHDSFSNWNTQQSDWKITNTAYGKDVLKMLADECQAQGIKLGLYYSTLDWFRNDYPHQTGRTGQGTGRHGEGNYDQYLRFMKAQLTELLTGYGPITAVWFDGHWDQTNPEGNADRTSRIDWRYDEIYALIHRLQPACLIGNNHHLAPLPGEDFQMFERDLPGENQSGLSFQAASQSLPLETCQTINGSWGFNITDTSYKTPAQVIQYLVNAAGRNANLLLNIGPMPDGSIQPEFVNILTTVGNWLQKNGATIYGTRGTVIAPQDWGVATAKENKIFLHILKDLPSGTINVKIPGVRVLRASAFESKKPLKFKTTKSGISVEIPQPANPVDQIIELTIK